MEGLLGRLGMTRFRRVDDPAGRVAPVGTHVVAVLALVATLLSVVPADTASAQPGQVVNFRITNQISFIGDQHDRGLCMEPVDGQHGVQASVPAPHQRLRRYDTHLEQRGHQVPHQRDSAFLSMTKIWCELVATASG